ncbi:MAG: aminotransferase class V-fold PLP-dependent enzyme [Verrucomicrobiota bacterium]
MLDAILSEEGRRLEEFPVARKKIFMAHAAVTILPQRVARAMAEYAIDSAEDHQEFEGFLQTMQETRRAAAQLIGAQKEEIALLGPTSLGLNIFSQGLDWEEGDEVVCYFDDYPANVYPWMALGERGVKVRFLEPENPGEITPELVAASLTEKTKLVALASCHFSTGTLIDVDAIGQLLHARGVLFSLDAIQTVGAFPSSVEHVDFLSADAHKWMLGPMAMGIVYVAKEHFEKLRPLMLGAWNVKSPDFIAQDRIELVETAQRYESGVLNASGIVGMKAAIDLLMEVGIEVIAERLLRLKRSLLHHLEPLGFEPLGFRDGASASGITSLVHPSVDLPALFQKLAAKNVVVSQRHLRGGKAFLRFSPHFYNTEEEIARAVEVVRKSI